MNVLQQPKQPTQNELPLAYATRAPNADEHVPLHESTHKLPCVTNEEKRSGNCGAYFNVLNKESELSRIRDNSDSGFETLKYMPVFPVLFGSFEHASDFMGRFVHAYNTEHRHSGFHSPADVHCRMTGHLDDQRLSALEKVWEEHPERFGKNLLPEKILLPEVD